MAARPPAALPGRACAPRPIGPRSPVPVGIGAPNVRRSTPGDRAVGRRSDRSSRPPYHDRTWVSRDRDRRRGGDDRGRTASPDPGTGGRGAGRMPPSDGVPARTRYLVAYCRWREAEARLDRRRPSRRATTRWRRRGRSPRARRRRRFGRTSRAWPPGHGSTLAGGRGQPRRRPRPCRPATRSA